MSKEIKKGQFALGYNEYGELCGGKVHSVTPDGVQLSGIKSGLVHPEDVTILDEPENKVPDERLKPHVVEHRKREEAAAKVAK